MFLPNLKVIQKIIKDSNVSTPFFITDKQILVDRVKLMNESFQNRMKIFYAIKANYNPSVVKILKTAGIYGIDAVSPYEVLLAKKLGFSSEEILYTGVNNSKEEIDFIVDQNILMNIGSIEELKYFSQKYPDEQISIRINPGVGDGETKGVITGGKDSKFGILDRDIDRALEIIKRGNLKLVGVHNHIGSGFYRTEYFQTAVKVTLDFARKVKGIKFLDFGGGFGIRYRKDDKQINLKDFYHSIEKYIDDFEREYGRVEYRLEPGKFLVGESTCMITRVTDVKETDFATFLGVDTGINHMPRYALYGSYHNVENISSESDDSRKFRVVGNICESTDIISENAILPANTKVGDFLAIQTAGAYCASMSSNYNFRPCASEVIVDGKDILLTKKKKTFEEMFNYMGVE